MTDERLRSFESTLLSELQIAQKEGATQLQITHLLCLVYRELFPEDSDSPMVVVGTMGKHHDPLIRLILNGQEVDLTKDHALRFGNSIIASAHFAQTLSVIKLLHREAEGTEKVFVESTVLPLLREHFVGEIETLSSGSYESVDKETR